MCCSVVFGFVNPLPISSKAIENGGVLPAIDAYQDGVGAMVVEQARGIDNSPMNNLVFKYGASAKSNDVRLDDEVIVIESATSSAKDKADAVKINAVRLALEGTTCDDGLATTMLDHYENGVCVGTVMNCQNGYYGSFTNVACHGLINTPSLSVGWLNLTNAGGYLSLHSNPNLTNINELINLNRVAGMLHLYSNSGLQDISGISNLTSVGTYVFFDDKTYTTKLPANSWLCQNYATKIYFKNIGYATATTKLQVCNP